jgi:chromosome segregation ATPase
VPGRINAARLSEAAALLNGPSVTLTKAAAPLSKRELTSGGQTKQTLLTTVREMRRSFSEIAAVVTAAETVWNEISDGIRVVTIDLETAKAQLPALGADSELTSSLDQAEYSLHDLRELLNSDPLTLWRGGAVDTAPLDRLRKQAAAATAQVAELAKVRADADQRLAEVTGAVSAAQQAHQDAIAARERAATRVNFSAVNALRPLPDISGLASRASALPALKTAGRWTRLASELDVLGKQAAAVTKQCKDAEQAAAGLIGQRNEMRGLLDSYRAMAGGLGAAENAELAEVYQRAKDLLWTAPCDLEAATAAVNGYQQAVLRLRRSGGRR